MQIPIRRVSLVGSCLLSALLCCALAPGASAREVSGPAYLNELGSGLLPLRSGDSGAIADARAGDIEVRSQSVLVDVYVSGDAGAASQRLRDLGMSVGATGSEPLPVVEGWLPVDELAPAAKLGLTDAVLPVSGGGTDIGAKTSEGVAAHHIPAAISASGTSGAGVISDSIDRVGGGISDSQGTGDLPPDPRVVVLNDGASGATDEGRAMAEIIYDEAPGLSRLLFSTGGPGPVGKAASIDSLVANGADVIADDIFYLSEPMFQDGQVALAADQAKAAGVAYFASAGNRARQSYEGTFSPSGALHDFDPSAGVDTRNAISPSVPNNDTISFELQWDEPWGRATTDLDIRLVDPTTGTAISGTVGGATANITTGIPAEFISYKNTSGVAVPVAVQITRAAGTRAPFMKWIEQDNISGNPVPEFNTASNTINPDAASATGTMSVAAVSASDAGTNTPESYSSRGPNTRLFDSLGNRLASPEVRINPDLAAADDVSNTVPGNFQPTFTGTSAATPSAAGIATILRSLNPNASVNEIYAQMSNPLNSIDCTSSALVPDPDCGSGFILADSAVAALDRTAPLVGVAVAPPQPTGKGGWYTGNVAVNWSVTDPESPIEAGCPSVTDKTDGTETFSCNAVSGGGQAADSVEVNRDTKAPSKPKVKGIKKGKTYSPSQLPAKVKCKSKDATSGLASCKVKGLKDGPGKHKLKAIAKDVAGLKSVSKIPYEVR